MASSVVDQALEKRRFWERPAAVDLNARQRKVLQRLVEDGDGGFLGDLTSEKYQKMTGAPKSTATRDLSDMVSRGLLWTDGVGKAVRYHANVPGWSHGADRVA
ncbi:hypothetical protein SNE35_24565 [Paucibacter sp. R3-3]|uniref:Uncharacterized protein n=1 Tax=Roseateles agri TaxID=3098619 RepID=A0ABU5DNI4_9BURK|nr:hypothetical protein [Paucibacter sp. R3-3]MDY0747699.1 hypothetical protein [Paucibacter sp. R3-3]